MIWLDNDVHAEKDWSVRLSWQRTLIKYSKHWQGTSTPCNNTHISNSTIFRGLIRLYSSIDHKIGVSTSQDRNLFNINRLLEI